MTTLTNKKKDEKTRANRRFFLGFHISIDLFNYILEDIKYNIYIQTNYQVDYI